MERLKEILFRNALDYCRRLKKTPKDLHLAFSYCALYITIKDAGLSEEYHQYLKQNKGGKSD